MTKQSKNFASIQWATNKYKSCATKLATMQITKTYNNLATNFGSSIRWEKHTNYNLATNLGAIQWQNKNKNQTIFATILQQIQWQSLCISFSFLFYRMQRAPPPPPPPLRLLLHLLLLCPFVTASSSSSSSSFCYSSFAGWRCLIVKLQTALFWTLQLLREQICMQECVVYCIVSSHDRDPPSLPPLASLETEEYFGRRTIMILGCCSCCCVFGPSFSSSERGSWTTSKEAAAVQTTTVGEALQKLLPKERRVVHKGFHYGFSGNRFIHYSFFAWIDTYFFCSRNTRNATIFFTERLRETESLPTYRKTELAAAVKKKKKMCIR